MTTSEKLQAAATFLKPHATDTTVGVVLGSGLGNFVQELTISSEIPYQQIPHFPVATVEGHSGKLIFGTLGGKAIVAMAGRFHFYEGYTAEEVVFPIRVLKRLGIETLLISNAAGGTNPLFQVGDLMIITDHISFATVNPLLGKNESGLGPRFPDMSEPYKKVLIGKAKDIAQKEGIAVQEVIAANHAGMQVFALSVITDIGIRDEENTITHEEVLQAANAAEPKLTRLFSKLIAAL